MCEVWPGPRCNDKCQVRDIKRELFYQISKIHGKNTPEYNNAMAELLASQQVYDTTPRGIKELYEEVKKEDSNSVKKLNIYRLIAGKSTRLMQIEALNEIKNGRVSALAKIVSSIDDYYSPEEVEAIIASARENKEEAAINKIHIESALGDGVDVNDIDSKISSINANSGEEYYEYVKKVGEALNAKFGNNISQELIDASHTLDALEPPSEINFHAYRSIGNAINKAKEQTRDEIMRIAAIQDSSPKTIAEYFDAYRVEYNNKYSQLPSTEQPNPPKEWVEGSLPQNGIIKNSSSSFIPRDPATIYAIYKLRTDLNAVPDYLKKSTKYSAIDYNDKGFTVTHVSRTGKELKKENFADLSELNKIIKRDSKDSVIILAEETPDIQKEVSAKDRIISLKDIASKHFNTSSKNMTMLASEFKTQESTLSLYGAMRKKILKTWATKPLRSNTPVLDFAPKGDSRSIKLVR